jgi:hypothetical protein
VSDMGSSFQKVVEPSMFLAKNLGNLGTGSVFGSLVSVLTSVSAGELQGKRVGVFTIGRGTTVFFSLRIAANTGAINKRLDLERRLEGLKIVPLAKPPVNTEVVQVKFSSSHWLTWCLMLLCAGAKQSLSRCTTIYGDFGARLASYYIGDENFQTGVVGDVECFNSNRIQYYERTWRDRTKLHRSKLHDERLRVCAREQVRQCEMEGERQCGPQTTSD